MSAKHSSLDARFAQAKASQRLQHLLHLAKVNREVSDWIYNDCSHSQRAHGILSPERFTTAVAVCTIQSCMDLAVPLTNEKCSDYAETFVYDVFVPVKEYAGMTAGYSFHSATIGRGSSFIRQDIFPEFRNVLGRYVYKKDTRTLLMLWRSTSKTDVVVHVHWESDTRRAVSYYVVPHQQYTFDNHPSFVICSGISHADFVCQSSSRNKDDGSAASMVDTAVDDTLPSGPADFVDGDWRGDNVNSLPQCILYDLGNDNDNENRYYRDSSAWLNEHQRRSLSKRHTKGLIQFESRRKRDEGCNTPVSVLEGNFFSAYVVRDVFDESGSLGERLAFEVRTSTSVPEADRMDLLRKVAVQVYYGFVLWASTDQCLVAAQEHLAAELLWGKGNEMADE